MTIYRQNLYVCKITPLVPVASEYSLARDKSCARQWVKKSFLKDVVLEYINSYGQKAPGAPQAMSNLVQIIMVHVITGDAVHHRAMASLYRSEFQ